MKINHPIYTHAYYHRPLYKYIPKKEDYRASIITWDAERKPLLERIRTLELQIEKITIKIKTMEEK
jgi:hypothetical protein